MTSSSSLKDNLDGLRFWVFSWGYYYPSGGFSDFDKGFDTLEEVYEYIDNEEEYVYRDMLQIFDSKEKKVIEHDIDIVDGKVELT